MVYSFDRVRHYLDFAATSAIRPDTVAEAMSVFLRNVGASPGRGGHGLSVEADRICFRCRRTVARLLGVPGDPGRIAFMLNATHALNTALWGLLRPGDAVVVSQYDHNAVLRPVHYLKERRGVEVRMLRGDPEGGIDLDEVDRFVEGARLVVVNAVSNVLGTRLPVREIAGRAHAAGALVLVDAAQSAGHVPGSHPEEGADLIAFTGHKGLLGPQGTGGLWIREGLEIDPFCTGGTGGNSALRQMPEAMPDRLEAGTQNAPGFAGLLAGCQYVLEEGVEALHARETALKSRLREGLAAIPGVQVRTPAAPDGAGIVMITVDATDPASFAADLERSSGVMSRPGLHCAPEAHAVIGTAETGAIRFSLGWASTENDVERTIEGVEALLGPTAVQVG